VAFYLVPRNIYPPAPYGGTFWGGYWAPPPNISFGVADAPLRSRMEARPRGFGAIVVQWEEPSDNFDFIMLVRNSYGPPLTPTDGAVLFQTPRGTLTVNEYVDDGLAQGQYYYYSLFIRLQQATPQWRRVGTVIGTSNADYGDGVWMYELLPLWYRQEDGVLPGHPFDNSMVNWGPLKRYLELIGRQLDLTRVDLQAALDSTRADKIRSDILQCASQQYGFPYEPYLGDRQTKRLFGNWVHILKRKGTRLGVETFVSAVTGYSTTTLLGKNLLRDRDDSDFYETKGQWIESPTGQFTLTRDVSDIWLPAVQRASLKVKRVGPTTDMLFGIGPFTISKYVARHSLIAVTVGNKYWLTFATKALTSARTVQGVVNWWSKDGIFEGQNIISMTEAQQVGTWVQHTHAAAVTAPANADYAFVSIKILGTASNEEHRIGGVMFSTGTTTDNVWEPARQIGVRLAPVRRNLCPNPSVEQALGNWVSPVGADTIARVTSKAIVGVASAELTSGQAGASRIEYSDAMDGLDVYAGAPLTQGTRYSLGAWVLGLSTQSGDVGVSANAFVRLFNGAAVLISQINGPTKLMAYDGWLPVEMEWVLPAGVASFKFGVQINGITASGKKYYMDAVILEQDGLPTSYFDASIDLTSFDYLWAGSAHASSSLWYPNRYIRDKRLRTMLPDMLPTGTSSSISYGL
jgi:hypothetical protein